MGCRKRIPSRFEGAMIFLPRDATTCVCWRGLGSRNSFRASVFHTRALCQNQTMHCRFFDITRKGNHSGFLTPTVAGGQRPLLSELKVTRPFEKRRLRQMSAHNVSIVGDSEKSSITTNIKSTTGFSTSYRWSAYVTHKSRKGGPKSDFFPFF